MFFHGIDLKYLRKQYPCFFPDAHVSRKNKTQLEDREHLIQHFGFEPVHLLEGTKNFPASKCLKECFSFGEIVFAFRFLQEPILQISDHEIAVPYLDVRNCSCIFVKEKEHKKELAKFFPRKLIFLVASANKDFY